MADKMTVTKEPTGKYHFLGRRATVYTVFGWNGVRQLLGSQLATIRDTGVGSPAEVVDIFRARHPDYDTAIAVVSDVELSLIAQGRNPSGMKLHLYVDSTLRGSTVIQYDVAEAAEKYQRLTRDNAEAMAAYEARKAGK